ncbi:MAG: hypothetical protein H8F28_03220 [Fibrella sp.]|nr:hypothetical protein [Armatimonadota bacterium]
MTYTIRSYDANRDDLEAITRLLHRAYAPLKEQGMWFVASVQDVEATRSRLASGFAFVAVDDTTGSVLGTITVYSP